MTPEPDRPAMLSDVREMFQEMRDMVREIREGLKKDEPASWMRAPEIAQRLGIPKSWVLELCRRKIFVAKKRGGWLIHWETANAVDLSMVEDKER